MRALIGSLVLVGALIACVPVQPEVYYENCAVVIAAGAAPIYRGQPGYRPALDHDGDGIGCEDAPSVTTTTTAPTATAAVTTTSVPQPSAPPGT